MRRIRVLTIAAILVMVLPAISLLADSVSTKTDYTAEQKFLFETIKSRRSVRSFKNTPIPREHILQVLDMARMAPTAGNQQPWKFLVVQDKNKIEQMRKASVTKSLTRLKMSAGLTQEQIKERTAKTTKYYSQVYSAPVYIVVLVDTQSRYPTYNRYDGPLAAGYLMIAARGLGYGTVFYTGSISDDVCREVLAIPKRYERVCITPLGVPEAWPKNPDKKNLKDFIVFEKF